MPRSLRIEFPGAYYHVMARGNRRETIFHDDDDRRFFLATLSEACAMTGWRVHAWVLMGNHYHLFIETPEANLVAGMSWLQNTVTRRYNVRHQAWGRLFGDRYKAVLVEGADTYHYRTLADYIHLNPVRARLVVPKKGQSVLDYSWKNGVREKWGQGAKLDRNPRSPYAPFMPRSLRIEFPGAYYHVMARGNRRETIFHDDNDRRFFLATLSEACAMTGWRVHASLSRRPRPIWWPA